ncbi:MAG TPA: GMC family oxidoreductase, partial [Candidatus Bathyarchaeia archaeon]|nr:GMC family oxidoreductase [Candidatus Bathyarchaeia archaeon]
MASRIQPIRIRRRVEDHVLGNRSLFHFDFCVIGSGAGGGTAAHVLTAAGKTVLVLEAGDNSFPGLDDPSPLPFPLHSNDEIKYTIRNYIGQSPTLEPRTFRKQASEEATIHSDVNLLAKAVGGSFQHADCKTPRFNATDFRLKSTMEALIAANPGLSVPGFGADSSSANFADWPFSYDDLEPFYAEAEELYGVQGAAGANIYESRRSGPYPMPPGVSAYAGLLVSEGARKTMLAGEPLHPHPYPAAINSRFYDGRPPCVDCGLCSGWGCPNNSKNSPAVTTIRRALLTGRCQLRFNSAVIRLVNDGGHVQAVEYVDPTGNLQTVTADAFILAASPIESARLCYLSSSPSGGVLGNSSGQVGRNLMFHFQTNVDGFAPQRIHGQRSRAVSNGITDFRGVEPGGETIRIIRDGSNLNVYMGGICEMGSAGGTPITTDGSVYAFQIGQLGATGTRSGLALKNAMRDMPLGQHVFGLTMQAEDAPQLTNQVDLDPTVRDIFGVPVPRVTYRNHPYEQSARQFYIPLLKQIVMNAGATSVFVAPCDAKIAGPPTSAHIMGTLRMGSDSRTSVTNPAGRFHDVDNLYATDGSV